MGLLHEGDNFIRSTVGFQIGEHGPVQYETQTVAWLSCPATIRVRASAVFKLAVRRSRSLTVRLQPSRQPSGGRNDSLSGIRPERLWCPFETCAGRP